MKAHPCGERIIVKLLWWCGAATMAAIMLGFAVKAGPASVENTDRGPIAKVLFTQYSGDTTAKTEGASGDLSIGGTGALCSDYSYSGIHWPNPNSIKYWINPTGSGVDATTAVNAVTAAFDTWGNASGPLSFSYQGQTSVGAESHDGKNVVSWGDVGGDIALTTTWYYPSTGEITEADTVISTSLAWSYTLPNVTHDLSGMATPDTSRYSDPSNSGVAGTYDIRNVMTHEAGHWLDLGDLYGGTQTALTMYGYAGTAELNKDTLAYGDELGVETIYPTVITISTSGLASTHPAMVHFVQGGVEETNPTYGTWSRTVDDGSAISIDSEVEASPTEQYITTAQTSWTATQTATYTVPYFHQFKPTVSAVTAGNGNTGLDAANCATLTYSQSGVAETYSIFDGHSFSDWVDAGSTASLSNVSSASTWTHRWSALVVTSWVVTSADSNSVSFWEQFRPTISVTTVGSGHRDLGATNCATQTYQRYGFTQTFGVFDGQSFNDWLDMGSVATLSSLSSASTSTHRWQSSGTTSWVMNDASPKSVSYLEEYKVKVTATGLDTSSPATVSVVQDGTTENVPTSAVWSDWVDVGSRVNIDDVITVSPTERYHTTQTHSWTANSAVTANLSYTHQFLASISAVGLTESHPTTITLVQDGGTNNATALDAWSDWVDANSALSVDKSVQGGWVGDWSAKGTTSWTVGSPISATVNYQRSYIGLYVLVIGIILAAGAVILVIALIRRRRAQVPVQVQGIGIPPVSGDTLKQPPQQAICPFCRSTTFRVVEEAGSRRCSDCHTVLPSYVQGNK